MRRLLLAVVVALASCSKAAPKLSYAGSTVHDSAGVQIVENGASAGGAWQVDSVPVTAIGSDENDPKQHFQWIRTAARLADGRVVVAGDAGVQLFDQEGVFKKAVTRSGEGPGEFRYIQTLIRLAGDTLMVSDGRRTALFNSAGDLLSEETLDRERFNKLGRWGECGGDMLPDRSRLACSQDPSIPITAANRSGDAEGEGDPGPGLLRQMRRQYLIPASLDTAYKLGVVGMIEQFGVKTEQSTTFIMHPFYSRSLLAAAGSPMRIATLTNPEYQIEIWTPKGTLERIIRRQNGRRVATVEEKAAAPAAMRRMMGPVRDTLMMNKVLGAVPTPDSLPAAMAIAMTDAGEIVVQREGMLPGQKASLFDVFDKEGRWIGELRLPPRVRLLEVGVDYLLYIRLDSDDVPHVEVHRMKAPMRR